MRDAPTFDTTTGEPCPCVSHQSSHRGVQFLLYLVTALIAGGMVLLLVPLMTPSPVLPAPTPQSRSAAAIPSPTTAAPSPSPNPLIVPTYMTVFVTTPTPAPTATMTSYQEQATAIVMTQVADKVPKPCTETTVTPGTPRICYWATEVPTAVPTPEYRICATPLPSAYCLKER